MTTIANSTTCWTSTACAVDAMKTLTSSTATTQSNKKPTWKWSGEDTPFEHRRWDDDEDDRTSAQKEKDYARWYQAQPKVQWRNSDEDEEPKKKRNISEFGLCCSCKKHLNDSADFVCHPQKTFYRLCTKCHEGYSQPWYLHEEKQGADP
jgi:hypothetical protein